MKWKEGNIKLIEGPKETRIRKDWCIKNEEVRKLKNERTDIEEEGMKYEEN